MANAVNTASFQTEVLDAQTPVLVDFWAVWCGPCKVLDPIVEEVEKSLGAKLKVVKVNVDEEPELSQRFTVMSIPTLILFKNGEPVETVIGVIPKPELEKKLNPHL
jgi:thioredoxin